MITTWIAPAKINLFLSVLRKREDGYHLIQTLFQFLDYGDLIRIVLRNDNLIRLLDMHGNLIKETNLIILAANELRRQFFNKNKRKNRNLGADIFLEKKIPIGGGLGGASSDAATTLIILNLKWDCKFTLEELKKIGKKLGADIPIFIHGHSAFAEGIGERVTSVKISEKWYLIVVPPIRINTGLAFSKIKIKKEKQIISLNTFHSIPFQNDFEIFLIRNFPIIKNYFFFLSRYASFRFTGTGSCMFAEFDDKKEAYKTFLKIQNQVCSFVARGVNTSPLHRMIFENFKNL